jgi:hypothetical protein
LRISRLAEESRERYITKIIDHLNSTRDIHIKENTDNYIFGSNEILNMIFYRKKDIYIKLSNGGFYNFNNTSINNTKHWLHYLKPNENNDSVYEKIILFLETNVDILDFSIENKDNLEELFNLARNQWPKAYRKKITNYVLCSLIHKTMRVDAVLEIIKQIMGDEILNALEKNE